VSFHNRSDALIELLEELTQEGQEYVLVGGYAVSAFNARFSTDLDIVSPRIRKRNSSSSSKTVGSKRRTVTPKSGSTTRK
jgi:hypothetical protein